MCYKALGSSEAKTRTISSEIGLGAYVSRRQHTSAYVSISQHTAAYVRQKALGSSEAKTSDIIKAILISAIERRLLGTFS